ncbi:MAG: hypothetical protein HWN65_18080 [Candidatus Helarchaeota archaeon]|nr:hypothetical protein [Candidatus Helarchaeota archaeon]
MWQIFLWVALFIGGYIIIYFSADVFLDNLKDLCIVYGLSAFIMGSLIIGIDPEESVASIMASANNLPYIAVGNVIGNSIIALTLCFAIPALFYRFTFKKISAFHFIMIYASLFVIMLGFFISFGLLIAGVAALSMYLIYLIRNIKYSRKEGVDKNGFDFKEEEEEDEKSKRKMIVFIIVSFAIIVGGGQLMIWAAKELIIEIVTLTGISGTALESVFGFVIIAFVTNVEELTLIIKSIQKHSVEIGIGGMIGKLVWNLTITFGISAVILLNITFTWSLIWNSLILLAVLTIFYLIARKGKMGKIDGVILSSFFVLFLIVNFLII